VALNPSLIGGDLAARERREKSAKIGFSPCFDRAFVMMEIQRLVPAHGSTQAIVIRPVLTLS
jgi:hypothetical protein